VPYLRQSHLEQQHSTFAARSGGSASQSFEKGMVLPRGMCGTPGLCGRNETKEGFDVH